MKVPAELVITFATLSLAITGGLARAEPRQAAPKDTTLRSQRDAPINHTLIRPSHATPEIAFRPGATLLEYPRLRSMTSVPYYSIHISKRAHADGFTVYKIGQPVTEVIMRSSDGDVVIVYPENAVDDEDSVESDTNLLEYYKLEPEGGKKREPCWGTTNGNQTFTPLPLKGGSNYSIIVPTDPNDQSVTVLTKNVCP